MIKFSFPQKDFKKTLKKLNKNHNIAIVRTLNELSRLGVSIAAKDIQKDIGVRQSDVRFAIGKRKATGRSLFFGWRIKTRRFDLPKAKQLKRGGVSFLADGRKRKKLKNKIKGGSKPFLLKRTRYPPGARGERISKTDKPVVYKDDRTKKLKTMKAHSLAVMLNPLYIKKIRPVLSKRMPQEYLKQLEKSVFRGRVRRGR